MSLNEVARYPFVLKRVIASCSTLLFVISDDFIRKDTDWYQIIRKMPKFFFRMSKKVNLLNKITPIFNERFIKKIRK